MLIEECCMREYTEQELVRREKARKLREKLKLKDKKLHCCKIMPDGRLGLYRFAND